MYNLYKFTHFFGRRAAVQPFRREGACPRSGTSLPLRRRRRSTHASVSSLRASGWACCKMHKPVISRELATEKSVSSPQTDAKKERISAQGTPSVSRSLEMTEHFATGPFRSVFSLSEALGNEGRKGPSDQPARAAPRRRQFSAASSSGASLQITLSQASSAPSARRWSLQRSHICFPTVVPDIRERLPVG